MGPAFERLYDVAVRPEEVSGYQESAADGGAPRVVDFHETHGTPDLKALDQKADWLKIVRRSLQCPGVSMLDCRLASRECPTPLQVWLGKAPGLFLHELPDTNPVIAGFGDSLFKSLPGISRIEASPLR